MAMGFDLSEQLCGHVGCDHGTLIRIHMNIPAQVSNDTLFGAAVPFPRSGLYNTQTKDHHDAAAALTTECSDVENNTAF